MIPPRLIPVLLLDRERRVVKTIGFGPRTYIGDPLNIIRLFNEKEVDEICILDIDATADGRPPDYEFAAELAAECFMPLSFGGGITHFDQARRLISSGIEKLVLRTHANEALIGAIVREFGRQAVVGCLDYRICDGMRVVGPYREPVALAAERLISAGIGELILQSIDRDGKRSGMDLDGIAEVAGRLAVPVIALGGAGEVAHLNAAITAGADAAASGSAFSFIGKRRAVLITYPDYQDRLKAAIR